MRKPIMQVILEETPDGKYFCTVNIPSDPKDYVTADARTPRIALAQAALILERHHKE